MNVINKCRLVYKDRHIVDINKNIMFIFSDGKTLVATPHQLFRIDYAHYNYKKRLQHLSQLVEYGYIKNMTDLVDYCATATGEKGQMKGLIITQIGVPDEG